jgi:hypothetical protein
VEEVVDNIGWFGAEVLPAIEALPEPRLAPKRADAPGQQRS